ncbi:L-cystine transporter [Photobacterium damselae]|uniref:L-cystine transporter n=1 Tax=Photobacterium damselae TaxID=38293 RepID=UPI003907520B
MIYPIVNLIIFALLIALLYQQQRAEKTLSRRVFISLGLGVIFGACLQFVYGSGSEAINQTLNYVNIVGAGYVSLLKMIIMPLIMVSIIGAIIKVKDSGSLGKISGLSIGILLATTAASALIGILVTHLFGLSADSIVQGAREIARGEALQTRLTSVESLSFADMVISFFPSNPFADLAGARPTSTIAVVIFSAFIGVAGLTVIRTQPELGASFEKFIHVAQEVVRALVRMVLNLTPYGVLALMSKVVAGSNYHDILNLISFVAASYVGLALILVMHLVLVSSVGVNPIRYIKKILPVLTFAFTSRSSAGTIPLNIETQVKQLGNSDGVANFSASFGATMGQNGCAGLYPAMLAVMIAPTVGINPLDPSFMLTLIAVVTVSSFGIAGVGGGATFAALIVLSTLNMPVALAGLLISIEPLIDMGRTAINVSGSMTAGTITSRLLGQYDEKIFQQDEETDTSPTHLA